MLLAYIILWLSLQLLVSCQMIPTQRERHTATVVDKKLFILGGTPSYNTSLITSEFFYLDVSGKFNTKALSWQDLSSNTIPQHQGAATAVGGVNNNTLFLYGGAKPADITMALVYTYDPKSAIWITPNITGIYNIRKYGLTGIINNEGKMYLWGGTDTATLNDMNDMVILDTINLSFGIGASTVGAPSPRYFYGAVLLPDQTILYMGKKY